MIDFTPFPRFQKDKAKIIDLIPKWAMLYGVDPLLIEKQIIAAHVWYDANPWRAPRRCVTRALHNWMRIAQEFGKFKPEPHRPAAVSYKEPQPDGEVMTGDDFKRMREAL